jgi:kumamolisin
MIRFDQYVPLTDSTQPDRPGRELLGPCDEDERVAAVVVLRRTPDFHGSPAFEGLAGAIRQRAGKWAAGSLPREACVAAESDVDLVRKFAAQYNLTVSQLHPRSRAIRLLGTAGDVSKAFHVELLRATHNGTVYITHRGEIEIPEAAKATIVSVLLDGTPPDTLGNGGGDLSPLSPSEVAQLYNFPTDSTGAGTSIALIALSGGYQDSDITALLNTSNYSIVNAGTGNNVFDTSPASMELTTALEIALSIAPDATVVVYFAPSNDLSGLAEVLGVVEADDTYNLCALAQYIGWPETLISGANQLQAVHGLFEDLAGTLAMAVFAPSGDTGTACGATDGSVNVLYPASDPFVTGCGGTQLQDWNLETGAFTEVAWDAAAGAAGATGGGVSTLAAIGNSAPPGWQAAPLVQVPYLLNTQAQGRGVPDIAANASDLSPYGIYFNSKPGARGGTSSVPPLYAGLMALITEKTNSLLSQLFVPPLAGSPAPMSVVGMQFNLFVYGAACGSPPLFSSITCCGNNGFTMPGAQASSPGYPVATLTGSPPSPPPNNLSSWDACTGLGRIDATALWDALSSMIATIALFASLGL